LDLSVESSHDLGDVARQEFTHDAVVVVNIWDKSNATQFEVQKILGRRGGRRTDNRQCVPSRTEVTYLVLPLSHKALWLRRQKLSE
jgi:hypothetical protein